MTADAFLRKFSLWEGEEELLTHLHSNTRPSLFPAPPNFHLTSTSIWLTPGAAPKRSQAHINHPMEAAPNPAFPDVELRVFHLDSCLPFLLHHV